MEEPQMFTFIGSWLGFIFGIYKLFSVASESFSVESKRKYSKWLQSIKIPTNEKTSFSFKTLYVNVFGKRLPSFKSFGISCLISLVIVTIVSLIIIPIEREYGDYNFTQLFSDPYLLAFPVLLNFIPDYLSILKSKGLMNILERFNNSFFYLLFILLDVLLTLFIISIVGGISYLILTIGNSYPILERIYHWKDFLTNTINSGPLFDELLFITLVSTFFTTIWVLLYSLSNVVLKVLFRSRKIALFLKENLDIENNPMKSTGFVAMILVSILYLFIGILNLLF